MIEEERLKITILKDTDDGSVGDESRRLICDADFKFRFKNRVDFANVSNAPLRVRLQRNAIVAEDLLANRSDFAILGLDMIQESGTLIPLMPLGFGQCGLYLGVRNDILYSSPQDLDGLRVATSYFVQAQKFFNDRQARPIIIYRPGGEESFVNVEENNAEACVVISESGTSFDANNITQRESLLESQAYLVASPFLREKRGSERFVQEFLTRVASVVQGRFYTGVVMNTPQNAIDDVVTLLPSAESPTIAKLEEEGWFAVSSLIPREEFWDLVFKLQQVGARDIYEQAVKKIVPNVDDPTILAMMEKIYA